MTAGLRIFISYRSKDANEVRAVVDVLRAHGVDVWFAEYDVLSRDYDDFEAELDQQILKAIAGCTHGVVFLVYTAYDEEVGDEVERIEALPCRRCAEEAR